MSITISLLFLVFLQAGEPKTPAWNPVSKTSNRKLISTNVWHHWNWLKKQDWNHLPAPVLTEGPVIGDLHSKNVSVYWNIDNQPIMCLADWDDTGRGPQIFDLMRFLLFAQIDGQLSIDTLLEAYYLGLTSMGQHQNFLDRQTWSKENSLESKRMFMKKNSKDKKLNSSLLLPIGPRNSLAIENQTLLGKQIELFNFKILDTKFKINDSGSSAGKLRLWFLVDRKNQSPIILEAKELGQSAVSQWGIQKSHRSRIEDSFQYFCSEKLANEPILLEGSKKTLYEIREKKREAFDIEESQYQKPDFQKDWSLAILTWLGEKHRTNSTFKDSLINHRDLVEKVIKHKNNQYLELVNTLRKEPRNEK